MSRVVLFSMIVFAVIPTVAFKSVFQNSSILCFFSSMQYSAHTYTALFYSVYNVYKVVHTRKGSMLLALAMV